MLKYPAATAAICAALLVGCGCSGPRAPALSDETVYHNSRENFRFLVPEGWAQQAKEDVPSGKVEKERLLVQYQRLTADKPAVLEASLADLPESTDWGDYLAGPSFGASQWRQSSPAEPIEVNGVSAVRFDFSGKLHGTATIKEVVVFRRGERVYFFTGIFPAKDTEAREQVRRAVASVIWK